MDFPEIDNLQEHLKPLQDHMKMVAKTMSNVAKRFEPYLESISNSIKLAFEQLPESLKLMASCGWYFSSHMTPGETNYVGKLIENGQFDEADSFMVEIVTNHIDFFEKDLCKQYPTRARILEAAFCNHKKSDYISAIPLFLAQADGICFYHTKMRIYRSSKGKPEIRKILKELDPSSFQGLIVSPLMDQSLITASESKLEKFHGNLNRHEVLHGVSLTYHTKINSCKAISWIIYVSEFFRNNKSKTY